MMRGTCSHSRCEGNSHSDARRSCCKAWYTGLAKRVVSAQFFLTMRIIRFVSLALGASILASPVAAQIIGGRVVDHSTHLPAGSLTVLVLGDSDRVVARTETDAAGVFYVSLPARGQVHIRFALDSANTYDSDPITVGAEAFVQREFIVPLLKFYFEFQVERQVTTAPGSPQPRYPETLKNANIEGEVLAQFIVDTMGRAEMVTFKVLKSTHAGFTQSVMNVLPTMKFTPAEYRGVKVRQMVQQPFTFALTGFPTIIESRPPSTRRFPTPISPPP